MKKKQALKTNKERKKKLRRIVGFRTCRLCGGTGYISIFGGAGVVCRCNSMFFKYKGMEAVYEN